MIMPRSTDSVTYTLILSMLVDGPASPDYDKTAYMVIKVDGW